MFEQLDSRESLRNLIVTFPHKGQTILNCEPIAKATLATTNRNCDYRIFEDFAFDMIKETCDKQTTNILNISRKECMFDSTTILYVYNKHTHVQSSE